MENQAPVIFWQGLDSEPSGTAASASRSATSRLLQRRLSNDEPIAEIKWVKVQEVAIPVFPGPALDIRGQSAKPLIELVGWQPRVGRYSRPYLRIEVGCGPSPECPVESVDTVFQNRDGEDAAPPKAETMSAIARDRRRSRLRMQGR